MYVRMHMNMHVYDNFSGIAYVFVYGELGDKVIIFFHGYFHTKNIIFQLRLLIYFQIQLTTHGLELLYPYRRCMIFIRE